jgi:hypothetical protein
MMSRLPYLLPILLYLTLLVQADYTPYSYVDQYAPAGAYPGNQSFDYVAPWPEKYDHWYGSWRVQLTDISESVCNLSLAAFRGDPAARATLGPVRSYCWTHSNCIVQTLTPDIAQSIAGASILLGLMPTILSVLGLSVAEMALLHMNRPVLSFLLSLGAPAVYPGRFLIWEDPLRASEPHTGAWVIRAFPRKWAILISAAQYILVLGAIALNVYNAWTMGVRAVLVWFCDASYWPLLWVVLATVIHIIAVLSLRFAIRRKRPSSPPPHDSRGSKLNSITTSLLTFLRSEFTLSANATSQVRDHYSVRLGPLPVVLQYAGALSALAHLIFGTAMFSSLIYIGNADAIPIIQRFMGAAIVSRIVLQFEIGGMMKGLRGGGGGGRGEGAENGREVWRGIVQPLMDGEGAEAEDEGDGELEGGYDPKALANVAMRMTRV